MNFSGDASLLLAAQRGNARREKLQLEETLRVAREEIARLEAHVDRLEELTLDCAKALSKQHGNAQLVKRAYRMVGEKPVLP